MRTIADELKNESVERMRRGNLKYIVNDIYKEEYSKKDALRQRELKERLKERKGV